MGSGVETAVFGVQWGAGACPLPEPPDLVISGEFNAIETACAKATEAGAKRALVLPVGGAFHSPLMEPARAELAAAIEATEFTTPVCPGYQNSVAKAVQNPVEIKITLSVS